MSGTVAILTTISGAGIVTEPLLSWVISGPVVSIAYLYRSDLHQWIRSFKDRILLREWGLERRRPVLEDIMRSPSCRIRKFFPEHDKTNQIIEKLACLRQMTGEAMGERNAR